MTRTPYSYPGMPGFHWKRLLWTLRAHCPVALTNLRPVQFRDPTAICTKSSKYIRPQGFLLDPGPSYSAAQYAAVSGVSPNP